MSDITNTAVKAMVVLRKAYRTIDAKTSESFKEDDLTQTQFSVFGCSLQQRSHENR